MATVEQLLVRIDASTEQLRREIRRAEQSVSGMDRAVKRSTQSVERSFGTMGRQVIAAVASFEAVRRSTSAFITMADTAQVLEARIRLVTESQAEFNRVQAGALAVAQQTRLGLTDTVDLYTRLARATQDAGYSSEQLLGVTETINQAIRASGATASEASAALVQFSQGLASGALRGDELRSVLEQTPRLARAIADGTGIAFGQLRDVASEGGLTTERIINALQSQAQTIQAEFNMLPRTVGEAMTQVNNALQNVVGQTNAATGATGGLVSALDRLRATIEGAEFKAAMTAVVDFGSAVIRVFSSAAEGVGIFSQAVKDPSLQNLDKVLGKVMEPLSAFWGMFDRFRSVAGTDIAGGIDDGLNQFLPSAPKVAAATKAQEAFSKETEKVIAALEFELAQLTRTDREQEIYNRLKSAGVDANSKAGKQIADMAGALFDETEIRKELNEAIEAERELLEEATRVTRDAETETERFARTQADLNKLFEAGYITVETYNRAIRDADPAYKKAQEAAKKATREQERLREEYEKLALEPFKNALESVQRTFADTFEDIFSGGIRTFGDLADSIKRIMIRLAAEIATLQFFGPQGLNIAGLLGGAGGIGSAAGTAGGGGFLSLANTGLSIGKLFAGGGLANLGSNFAAGGLGGALFGLAPSAVGLGGAATASSLGVSAVAGGLGNAGIASAGTAGILGSGGALGALGIGGLAIGAVLLASQLFKKKPSDFTASFQGMLTDRQFGVSEDKANDQTRQMRDQIQTATQSALEAVLGGLGLDKPGNTYLDVAAGSRDGLRFWLYDTMDSYFGQPQGVRSDPIASGQFDNVEDLIAGVLSAVIERAGTEGLTTALRAVAENADFSDLETALADIDLAKFYDSLGQTAKLTAEADEAINEINARFDELTEFAERFGLAVDKVDTGRADAFADLASGFTEGLRDQILALTDPAQLAVRELEAWRDAQIRNAKAIAEANGMAGASTEDLALIMELYGLRMEQIAGDVGDALNYITAAQASVFNEQLRAVETYLAEVERNNETWRRLGLQLRQTRNSLLIDDALSPLSPELRRQEAARQFEDIARRAALGDQDAIAELPDISRAYLEASRAYYASSEAYFADFQRVQQVLADTEALTGRHVSIGDQQLAAARDQVQKLTDLINGDRLIVSSIEQANTILADILAQLQAAGVPGAGGAAGAGGGTGSMGTGISYVDTGYVRTQEDLIQGIPRTTRDAILASLGQTVAGGGVVQARIESDPAFADAYRDAIRAAGGTPGFATGGSFMVGGPAGNDNLVMPPVRVTAGEMVSVSRRDNMADVSRQLSELVTLNKALVYENNEQRRELMKSRATNERLARALEERDAAQRRRAYG